MKLALLLFASATAWAQFSDLSTIHDGSRVYFATSLRQRGTDQSLHSKIFMSDANGAHLVAERFAPPPNAPPGAVELDLPQVSDDGSIVLYRGTSDRPCPGSSCFGYETHSVTLTAAGAPAVSYPGNGSISRNGRYVALYSTPYTGAIGAKAVTCTILDRTTGRRLFEGYEFVRSRPAIAADGTTVFTTVALGSLRLIRDGAAVTLYPSDVAAAAIDDRATTIVYETIWGGLFIIDLKSQRQWQLGPGYRASLSSEGDSVLYLSQIGATTQLLFSRVDGTARRQLTSFPNGVVEATLSGDGTTAFATTGVGELVRIDTATGQITILVGPTPTVRVPGILVPGSIAVLEGPRLRDISFRLGGFSTLILNQSDTQTTLQIPWEVPLSPTDALSPMNLTIPEAGAPYFELAIPIFVTSFWPAAIPLDSSSNIAVHSDFGSIVTPNCPAVPGELLHIFMSGGGPVTCSTTTGSPAPLAPLCYATTPIFVGVYPQGLYVPFFGLAPGLVGVYQMDVMVPSAWSENLLHIDLDFFIPPTRFGQSTHLMPIPVNTGKNPPPRSRRGAR
jgi:uncharacterized protein (TIGR03437 family)